MFQPVGSWLCPRCQKSCYASDIFDNYMYKWLISCSHCKYSFRKIEEYSTMSSFVRFKVKEGNTFLCKWDSFRIFSYTEGFPKIWTSASMDRTPKFCTGSKPESMPRRTRCTRASWTQRWHTLSITLGTSSLIAIAKKWSLFGGINVLQCCWLPCNTIIFRCL